MGLSTNNLIAIILFIVIYIFVTGVKKKKRYHSYNRRQYKRTPQKQPSPQKTNFYYHEEKSAEEKGADGERFVAESELARLPYDLFHVFNDVIFPAADGTSQIDHVVVSDTGIFVIETKNYQGRIYGNGKSSEWYQYLGDNKYPFYNPILQNAGHLKYIARTLDLPESHFVSIVVFPNQTTLKVDAQSAVLHFYELADYIRQYSSSTSLTSEQIENASRLLSEAQCVDPEKKQTHIQYVQGIIREKDAKIAAGICPRCGGKLIQRNGKYGSFYGCSNYPNCQYKTH